MQALLAECYKTAWLARLESYGAFGCTNMRSSMINCGLGQRQLNIMAIDSYKL